MILLWGRSDDAPLAMLRDELLERDCLFFHIDEETARSLRFVPRASPAEGCIVMDNIVVDLADIHACYLRPDARWVELADADEIKRRQHFQYALCAWADVTPALVLNRPAAMWSNQSKPFQSLVAREAGFLTPHTLITTDPQAVRDFIEQHGRVIYKSISSVRSIVSELTLDDPRIDAVHEAPVQLQAYVEGVDHRVHVVGEQVFACRIGSAKADYRYDHSATLNEVELPAPIKDRCLRLAQLLGLSLTGIDLRRTPKGEWVCFEANPSPGYSYYQQHAGLPIVVGIAQLLQTGGSLGTTQPNSYMKMGV